MLIGQLVPRDDVVACLRCVNKNGDLELKKRKKGLSKVFPISIV